MTTLSKHSGNSGQFLKGTWRSTQGLQHRKSSARRSCSFLRGSVHQLCSHGDKGKTILWRRKHVQTCFSAEVGWGWHVLMKSLHAWNFWLSQLVLNATNWERARPHLLRGCWPRSAKGSPAGKQFCWTCLNFPIYVLTSCSIFLTSSFPNNRHSGFVTLPGTRCVHQHDQFLRMLLHVLLPRATCHRLGWLGSIVRPIMSYIFLKLDSRV